MQGIAGVPELAKGDRLRTCWRRPTRVRIPAPASNQFEFMVIKVVYMCRGGVGGYPTGLWIPRLGFESRPRPLIYNEWILFLNIILLNTSFNA